MNAKKSPYSWQDLEGFYEKVGGKLGYEFLTNYESNFQEAYGKDIETNKWFLYKYHEDSHSYMDVFSLMYIQYPVNCKLKDMDKLPNYYAVIFALRSWDTHEGFTGSKIMSYYGVDYKGKVSSYQDGWVPSKIGSKYPKQTWGYGTALHHIYYVDDIIPSLNQKIFLNWEGLEPWNQKV